MFANISDEVIGFETANVIWNRLIVEKPGHVKNFICLVVKQYIYRQRSLKQQIEDNEVIAYIKNIRSIEKYVAIKNNKF